MYCQGLKLLSEKFGNQVISINEVISSPSGAKTGKFDYVICANKALDQEGLPKAISAAITPKETTIVVIQNGVGAESYLQKEFPENTILSCVTWVGAKQTEPGIILHINNNSMTMGIIWNKNIDPAQEAERMQVISDLLRKGGTEVEIVNDIISKRWEKVVWNAAWNSFTALTMLDTKRFLGSSEQALVVSRRLMNEVVSVANVAGAKINSNHVEQLLDKTLKSEGLTSSMMVDLANNHPMEVEGILGNPMRVARELNVATPTLDCLYVLIKAQDSRVRNLSKV